MKKNGPLNEVQYNNLLKIVNVLTTQMSIFILFASTGVLFEGAWVPFNDLTFSLLTSPEITQEKLHSLLVVCVVSHNGSPSRQNTQTEIQFCVDFHDLRFNLVTRLTSVKYSDSTTTHCNKSLAKSQVKKPF